jgi:hypothetical protein
VQGPGVYSFDVVVTDDGAGLLEDRETITVTVNEVNQAPVADFIADEFPDEGDVVSLTATASDSDVPANTLTWSLDSGPGAVDAAGNYTWATTEADGPGTYTVVLRVTDDGVPNLSDTVSFDITVAEVNVAPVLDPVGAQAGDELTLIGFTATASDSDLPANTLTFTLEDGAGSVPVGASITAGGVFTWTPTEAQGPGVYSFDVVVTDDGAGLLEDRETITVTVNEVNVAPVLDPVGAQAGDEDTVIGFTATASDADLPANTLTFSLEDGAGSVPVGAAIGVFSGVFTWTPTEAQGPGVYSFDVVVTDDGTPNLEDRETITVTVNEVNVAPVASADFYELEPGTVLSVGAPGVVANDTDPDDDPLVVTLLVAPSEGSLILGANGSFTYAHGGGGTASDIFVYQVDDGNGGLSSATVKFSLITPNLPPVALNDLLVLDEDTLGLIFPLANDADPDGDPLTFFDFTQPEAGLLDITPEGALRYVPPVDYSGEFTVGYSIGDGRGGSASAILTIIVNPVNDFPQGGPDAVVLSSYLPRIISVLDNDVDVDSDALFLESVVGDLSGTVIVNPDGTITYYPQPGWVGTETFSYVLSDGVGGTDTVLVSVQIPASVLTTADGLTIGLGTVNLPFISPGSDLNDPDVLSPQINVGVRLLADAFFQSLDALKLPLAFLGLALGIVFVLGGFTELPLLIAARRRRHWSVVLLDREHRLPVHPDPGDVETPMYNYEPTAAGFLSLNKPRSVGDAEWIEVETPNGQGWVQTRYLTEAVDLEYFLSDDRPVQMVGELAAALANGDDITALLGPRGLAIALTNRPYFIATRELKIMLDDIRSHRSRPSLLSNEARELRDEVLEPLRAALSATPVVDSKAGHSRAALIPVELWNFQYLVVNAPNHAPWLIYFEYRKGKPRIVGFGIDQ